MNDLVERLRDQAWKRSGSPKMEAPHAKMLEWIAADRIEELEKALERMARESDAELARLTGIIFDHTKERMRHSDD